MVATRKITLVLDSDIDDELIELAHSSGRDKQSLLREAVVEWLEDQEDIRDAKAILAQNNPSIPFEEVKRDLGLED